MKTLIRVLVGMVASIAIFVFSQQSVVYAQSEVDVTGGFTVTRGMYPSTAYLNTRGFQCGGVLIDREWVLTAAHCLDNNYPASKTLVQIGGIDKLVIEQDEYAALGIRKITHQLYNPVTHDYDLGLMKIPEVTMNQFTTVTKIYTGNAEVDVFNIFTTTVSGWGKTESGDDVRYLRAAEFQYVCRTDAITGIHCKDPYNPNKGVCHGDSGDPLDIVMPDGTTMLHSITWGGNQCDAEDRFGDYTKVGREEILKWIYDVINAPVVATYMPYLYGKPLVTTYIPSLYGEAVAN